MLMKIVTGRARFLWLALGVAMLQVCLPFQSAGAQPVPKTVLDYSKMMPQDVFNEPSLPLKVGTVINRNNWYKYRGSFTLTSQAMFSEQFGGITVPPPNWYIVVEPHRPVALPKVYKADTERYSKQIQLKELPSGGYTIRGYVAGQPFPDPSGPLAGVEWMYNIYYEYRPYVIVRDPSITYRVDKFGNISPTNVLQISYNLTHVSDPGMGHVMPGASPGYYIAQYTEQYTPEQSKYSATLAYFPDNPDVANDLYIFVPALRRVLRGSQRARCAPFVGSDLTTDDLNNGFNGIPSMFHAKVLGEKQILFRMHMHAPYWEDPSNFQLTHGNWPDPRVGGWEPREIVLVDITPIESVQLGYCYGHKLLYVDKESAQGIGSDDWDSNDVYWKGFAGGGQDPFVIPNSGGDVSISGFGNVLGTNYDFQGIHGTETITPGEVQVNTDVQKKYMDLARYATPGGLDRVMR